MTATWQILEGDCVERMRELDDCSIDAIVCDPPYGLGFMGKEWDSPGRATRTTTTSAQTGAHPQGRARAEYGGASYGGNFLAATRGFQAWCEAWAREALRVLKPGGHLLAFGGTRTYHRLAAGIEDAGFEIRDCLVWLYGSGFPKSLNVGKALDDGRGQAADFRHREAAAWSGHGTALKPAHEPVVVARKPLAGTVAGSVLEHGTGGLNIDECRVGMSDKDRVNWEAGRAAWADRDDRAAEGRRVADVYGTYGPTPRVDAPEGRWPANVVLDPEAAAMLDEQTGEQKSGTAVRHRGIQPSMFGSGGSLPDLGYGDTGGASRFFYVAKASRAERNAGLEGFAERPSLKIDPTSAMARDGRRGSGVAQNVHPTVKPIELMRWLVRLVTPPGGTVLDPFTGSGTTGCAAVLEGFDFLGIEREPEYVEIAKARISYWSDPVKAEAALAEARREQEVAEAVERGDAVQLGLEFEALVAEDGEAA